MTNTPERIWTCTHVGEYGYYFPDAVEAEGEYGGTAVEYTRADLANPLADPRVKALVEAANGVVNEYYNEVHGPVIYNIKHLDAALSALEENK